MNERVGHYPSAEGNKISRRQVILGIASMSAGAVDAVVSGVQNDRIAKKARTQVLNQLGNTKPYNEVKVAMEDAARKAVKEEGNGTGRMVAETAAVLLGGLVATNGTL